MSQYVVQDQRGQNLLRVSIDGQLLTATPASGQATEVPLHSVTVMRLNPPVATRYGEGHFLCTLVGDRGEMVRLRAEADEADVCREYARLVQDLHVLLLARSQPPRFMTGLGSALAFWLFVIVTAALMVLVTWGGIHGMARKQNYFVGSLFILACLGVGAWFIRFVYYLLHPSAYDPRVCQDLVPE